MSSSPVPSSTTVNEEGPGSYKHEKLEWLKEDNRRYLYCSVMYICCPGGWGGGGGGPPLIRGGGVAAGGGYSLKFMVGVCRSLLYTLTHFYSDQNLYAIFPTWFQTWHLKIFSVSTKVVKNLYPISDKLAKYCIPNLRQECSKSIPIFGLYKICMKKVAGLGYPATFSHTNLKTYLSKYGCHGNSKLCEHRKVWQLYFNIKKVTN